MFAGASNAPGGVTFDMKYLNDVLISEDLGTGNIWGDVYRAVDPMNRTVVGGRDTGVGVGGFTLGGALTPSRIEVASNNLRQVEYLSSPANTAGQ
jgi:hypothetical protein